MSLLTDHHDLQVWMVPMVSFCFCPGDHPGAGWSGGAGAGADAPVEAGGARSLARGLLDPKWLDKGCDFVFLGGLFQVVAREVVLDMCCSAHWELKDVVDVDADAGVDVDGVMEDGVVEDGVMEDGVMEDGGVEDADVLEHVDEDDVKDVEDVVLHVLDGIESAVADKVVDAVASDVRLELPVDLGVHTGLDLVVHTNLQVVFQVCHRRQLAQSVDPPGRPVSQHPMGTAHVDVVWEQRSCLVVVQYLPVMGHVVEDLAPVPMALVVELHPVASMAKTHPYHPVELVLEPSLEIWPRPLETEPVGFSSLGSHSARLAVELPPHALKPRWVLPVPLPHPNPLRLVSPLTLTRLHHHFLSSWRPTHHLSLSYTDLPWPKNMNS